MANKMSPSHRKGDENEMSGRTFFAKSGVAVVNVAAKVSSAFNRLSAASKRVAINWYEGRTNKYAASTEGHFNLSSSTCSTIT